mgnify:CR=1 FL=1
MSNAAMNTVTNTINTVVISEFTEFMNTLQRVFENTDYKVIFEATNLQQLLNLKWTIEPDLIIAIMNTSDSQLLSKFKIINERFPLPIVIFTYDDPGILIKILCIGYILGLGRKS